MQDWDKEGLQGRSVSSGSNGGAGSSGGHGHNGNRYISPAVKTWEKPTRKKLW